MSIPASIKSLHILCPSWVGDVVMSSCVWRLARATYPNAKITLVIRPHLTELLEGVDEIDRVLSVDTKKVFTGAQIIKESSADAILLLPNSFRSAMIAKLSGTPIRVGYRTAGRNFLLTHGIDLPKQNMPLATAKYYLNLACSAFGTKSQDATPSIGISNEQERFAKSILRPISAPIVLLVPGASKTKKRWPSEKFAAVADAIDADGATCCIVGSPNELSLCKKVQSIANCNIHNLAESGLSLGSLKAIVKNANLMITNDTGPRHLAVATGTPAITLYGPTDFRWTTHKSHLDIPVLSDPFLPDHLIADKNETWCAIEKIPIGDVIALAKKALNDEH